MSRRGLNPLTGSLVVLGALALAGLAAMGLAWNEVAASVVPALQVPYAVSGAMTGLAVLGFALAIASIQARRRAEARERAELDRVVLAAASLLTALRSKNDS
jgi:hypothetical protein